MQSMLKSGQIYNPLTILKSCGVMGPKHYGTDLGKIIYGNPQRIWEITFFFVSQNINEMLT